MVKSEARTFHLILSEPETMPSHRQKKLLMIKIMYPVEKPIYVKWGTYKVHFTYANA